MSLWVNNERCSEGSKIFSYIFVGLHLHYRHIMETDTGTSCLCGENIWRNNVPVFSKSNRKSEHFWHSQWPSRTTLWNGFYLSDPLLPTPGSGAYLCNGRFPSHGQRVQHHHWGACLCTVPTGPLGKQHALGQSQEWVFTLSFLPLPWEPLKLFPSLQHTGW